MSLERIESLLKATIGLDPESIGHASIANAVRERVRSAHAHDAEAYYDALASSPDELQALVEVVVVPETWFFRDRAAFTALTALCSAGALGLDVQTPLRLLSMPCSTGEEPYSMAMALLDAGIPTQALRIDAVDISAVAITRAERAVYGKNSFRGDALDFRDRYFTADGANFRLRDEVRTLVRFVRGNLFDFAFLESLGHYDAVFCRNLLIYFDREGQDRFLEALTDRMTSAGSIFVGPSEGALLLGRGFESLNVPLSFGFRRAVARVDQIGAAPAAAKRSQRKPVANVTAIPLTRPAAKPPFTQAPHTMPPARPVAPAPGATIELAEQLADQGRLAEAAAACDEYLKVHGPSAQAYYLLGLVRDTTGLHTEAAVLYGKSIYLDPQHQAALLHLASLRQQDGDTSGATRLRARAERVERAERPRREAQAPGAAR